MKKGAEEKTKDSRGHKDEDGPFGDELRIRNFWMKVHNHEYLRVKIVFQVLSLILKVLDKGKVKLVLKSLNDMRCNNILIIFFILFYLS